MLAYGIRALAAGLGLVLALGLSSALAQTPQAALVPAPDRHPETGLVFPDTLGPARKVNSNDYGKSNNSPKLGYYWGYQAPQLTTSFYVYNFGIPSIATGAGNAAVLQQFQQAQSDIEVGARAGRYEQLKVSQAPANCTFAALIFRCVTYSAVRPADKRPVFTRLLVTGYRNYFLKIRQDWPQDATAAARDVDAVILSLATSAKP